MKVLTVTAHNAADAVANLQVLPAQLPFNAIDLDAGRRLPMFGKHLADIGQDKTLTLLDAVGQRRFFGQAAPCLLRTLSQLMHPWRRHTGQERRKNHQQQTAATYRGRLTGAQGGCGHAAG